MNFKNVSILLFAVAVSISSQVFSRTGFNEPDSANAKVCYAGARSSSYGIRPFPDEINWEQTIKSISSNFNGSQPAAVWIVGELSKDNGCRLFFPSEGKSFKDVVFTETDKHEAYLKHFDENGIKVFLQVEPGNAEVSALIDIVMKRYGNHPCVIGFGVDVEWHKESERPGWGIPVSDSLAQLWEEKIKSFNPDYKLFLKHWDREWMPPSYRGDIIFISDSQQLANFNEMINEFSNYWAEFFLPNTVGFQIGYDSDRVWWGEFDNPVLEIGNALIKNVKQNFGIFWVDFTLRSVKLIP